MVLGRMKFVSLLMVPMPQSAGSFPPLFDILTGIRCSGL